MRLTPVLRSSAASPRVRAGVRATVSPSPELLSNLVWPPDDPRALPHLAKGGFGG